MNEREPQSPGDPRVERALRGFGGFARQSELFDPPPGLADELRAGREPGEEHRPRSTTWLWAAAAVLLVLFGAWAWRERTREPKAEVFVALAPSADVPRGTQEEFASGSQIHVHVRSSAPFRGALAMLDSRGSLSLLPDEAGRRTRAVPAGDSVPWIVELDDQTGEETLIVLEVPLSLSDAELEGEFATIAAGLVPSPDPLAQVRSALAAIDDLRVFSVGFRHR